MPLRHEQVPKVLELTAAISAILGPRWKLMVENWPEAHHISWHPDFAPDAYPVAVDFYSEPGGGGPCMVQVYDLNESPAAESEEISIMVNAVASWCKAKNIPLGFEQA